MKPRIKLNSWYDAKRHHVSHKFVCRSDGSALVAYGANFREAYIAWLRLKKEAARRNLESLQNTYRQPKP